MVANLYKIGRKVLYNELQPLFEALASVNYAVIKGEALSQQIYGEIDKRISSDIDILVDKRNVHIIEKKLRELGFEQKFFKEIREARKDRVLCLAYSHQIPSYRREKSCFSLNVDINHDIFWGEYEGTRFSIEEFLCDTNEMKIYNTSIKTLSIEKAFVQLILHHYKEMNSLYHLRNSNCIKTSMFRDVYHMLLYNREIFTPYVVKNLCDKYFIGDIVYYMIYYSDCVFNNNFLKAYLLELDGFKNELLIECYGLSVNERKKWKIPFEERLDNNCIWDIIKNDINQLDLRKIEMNYTIFS